MKVRIISSTKPNQVTPKNEFDKFSGHCAGICYMAHDFDTILNEDESKTERRVLQTAQGGHHSVFDHNYVTLYLEGIPKFLAMLLNNEKMYTTSEKSARYTKMSNISDLEKEMYGKWLERFKTYIGEKYPEIPEKKREKLAMENARYLLSILTPTCMAYTVSYRQLNYLYQWLKQLELNFNDFITKSTFNCHYSDNKVCNEEENKKWEQAIFDLIEGIEKTGYVNPNIVELKNRSFSLVQPESKFYDMPDIYTDVYSITYTGSFAQLAQAQRHRTINYSCTFIPKQQFYVPPILEGRQILLWLKDCETLYSHGYIPQCTEILIRERGTYEDFLLKCKERICSAAQLEIAQRTQHTLEEYIKAFTQYEEKDKSMSNWIYYELKQYATYKARCTYPDYKCPTPCGWLAGINLERQI